MGISVEAGVHPFPAKPDQKPVAACQYYRAYADPDNPVEQQHGTRDSNNEAGHIKADFKFRKVDSKPMADAFYEKFINLRVKICFKIKCDSN